MQTSNSTGIAVVTQLQPITVIFPIPEDDLPDILPQLNAGTPLEGQAYDRANVKMLATGRVAALDSQIDTTTGTVKVRAQFDNADNALFPNQFVNAQLLVKTLKMSSPCRPRRSSAARPGTLCLRRSTPTIPCRCGRSASVPDRRPMAAVESGLAVGERVVVDGTDRLRDGARVTVPRAAASQAPAARRIRAGGGRRPVSSNNRRSAAVSRAERQSRSS